MTKPFKTEYEKEPYYCSKCKKFHRYLVKKKPSTIHLEHFCYFYKYKKDYTQTEAFNLGFKKSWKRIGKEKKERTSKPLFIN